MSDPAFPFFIFKERTGYGEPMDGIPTKVFDIARVESPTQRTIITIHKKNEQVLYGGVTTEEFKLIDELWKKYGSSSHQHSAEINFFRAADAIKNLLQWGIAKGVLFLE